MLTSCIRGLRVLDLPTRIIRRAGSLFVALIILASLIDGTVEGTTVDTLLYDENKNHDHTYYGNACETNDGSKKSCSTRITTDGDNNDQKTGVYYNFQAVTVGTGAAIETRNDNSSDTFCPLGWQVPYGGTGGDYYDKSKSWKYFYDSYNLQSASSASVALRKYPFSSILAGFYRGYTGMLYAMGVYTGYYSCTVLHGQDGYSLGIDIANAQYAGTANKSNGMPIRCVDLF